MKKFFALCFLIATVCSCSIDDDSPNFYFEILPVESVVTPQEFRLGESAEITLTYIRPTSCHSFNDFYYVTENNQRTLAVINTVTEGNCEQDLNESIDVSFNFVPVDEGSYVFKFWQGEDDNGNDTYYIIEIPVVE